MEGFGKPPHPEGMRWIIPFEVRNRTEDVQRRCLHAAVIHHLWAVSVNKYLKEIGMTKVAFNERYATFPCPRPIGTLLRGDAMLDLEIMEWFMREFRTTRRGTGFRPPSEDLVQHEIQRAEGDALGTEGRARSAALPATISKPPSLCPRGIQRPSCGRNYFGEFVLDRDFPPVDVPRLGGTNTLGIHFIPYSLDYIRAVQRGIG
jgi:hypothetical protein